MYKNYLFDLYGTLVDINTNEHKTYLWDKMSEIYSFNGASYHRLELKKQYQNSVAQEKKKTKLKYSGFDYIDIRLENVFKQLYLQKGVTPSDELVLCTAQFFRSISTKYIKLYSGAKELLSLLRENRKGVYLLTNAQRCFTMPELKYLGIDDLFDGIVISSDEYTCKPDKSFYNIILKRYNLNVKDCIMVGNDYITDIRGSYETGMDSLYLHTNISPEVKGDLLATYKIMDGDIKKSKDLIL